MCMVSGTDIILIIGAIALLALFGKSLFMKSKDTAKTAVVETAKLGYEIRDELAKVRTEYAKTKADINITDSVKEELDKIKSKDDLTTDAKKV